MKITDSKVVKSGEKAFLNAVKDHLDWNAIRDVVTRKMKQCAIESRGGELVLHENKVAFRMDLYCAMDVSITFDRNGTLVSDEVALPNVSMDNRSSVDSEREKHAVSPATSEVQKRKKKAQDSDRRAPVLEKSSESNDDDAGVLELNDLLHEHKPEEKTSISSRKEDLTPSSDEDDDVDLETLFFKDKSDDDEFDSMADEGSAFWEDKK
ncbi:hypothetical protein [Desulfocicer niacini]